MKPSRNSESRDATARPAIGGEERGRLDIDTTGLPADLEMAWVREEVEGKYDQGGINNAVRNRGFRPATKSMLPAYETITLPGRPAPTDELIREGGLIAMVRSKADGNRERAYQRKETEEVTASALRLSTAPGANFDGENFKEDEGSRVQIRQEAGSKARFAE